MSYIAFDLDALNVAGDRERAEQTTHAMGNGARVVGE